MRQRAQTVGELNHWWAVLAKLALATGPFVVGALLSLQGWQLLAISAAQGDIKALQAQQNVLMYLVLEKVPEQNLGEPTEKGVPAAAAGVQ